VQGKGGGNEFNAAPQYTMLRAGDAARSGPVGFPELVTVRRTLDARKSLLAKAFPGRLN
jgi:hypothetical protein